MGVSISRGNEKMGSIMSVSLPAGTTCRPCACNTKCYAKRIEQRRPGVRAAYQNNLNLLNQEPEVFWREVEGAIMLSRFFRFHVSGDIPNPDYLEHMVKISERNQHCEILCFTKKFQIINDFLSSGGRIPNNLHIIFSAWIGLEMDNPYNLPEAHVRFRNGTTTARIDALQCEGNCSECATTVGGCWSLKKGEQVIFNEH